MNALLAILVILHALAWYIICIDEEALLRLAAWAVSRRMYLQNIRAESAKWKDHSLEHKAKFIKEHTR